MFATKKLCILFILIGLTCLTRGSHFLTEFNIPDASLIVFFLVGYYLPSIMIFLIFFLLGSYIDFGNAALDISSNFSLNNGYWGLIPSYLVMVLAGIILKRTDIHKSLNLSILLIFIATTMAYIISTNTYYMFSGLYGSPKLIVTILQGWEYFPSFIIPNLVYGLIFCLLLKLRLNNISLKVT